MSTDLALPWNILLGTIRYWFSFCAPGPVFLGLVLTFFEPPALPDHLLGRADFFTLRFSLG